MTGSYYLVGLRFNQYLVFPIVFEVLLVQFSKFVEYLLCRRYCALESYQLDLDDKDKMETRQFNFLWMAIYSQSFKLHLHLLIYLSGIYCTLTGIRLIKSRTLKLSNLI